MTDSKGEEPGEQILAKFRAMKWNTKGMGTLYYVSTPPAHTSLVTSVSQLPNALNKYLENTAVRLELIKHAMLILYT